MDSRPIERPPFDLYRWYQWLNPETVNLLLAAGGTHAKDLCRGLQQEALSRKYQDKIHSEELQRLRTIVLMRHGKECGSLEVKVTTSQEADEPLPYLQDEPVEDDKCDGCLSLLSQMRGQQDETSKQDRIRIKQLSDCRATLDTKVKIAEWSLSDATKEINQASQEVADLEKALASEVETKRKQAQEFQLRLAKGLRRNQITLRRKDELVVHLKTLDALATSRLAQIDNLETKLASYPKEIHIQQIRSQAKKKENAIKSRHYKEISDLKQQLVKMQDSWNKESHSVFNLCWHTQINLNASNNHVDCLEQVLKMRHADFDKMLNTAKESYDELARKESATTKELSAAERHLEVLLPISKLATKIRRRFWASGRQVPGKDAIYEAGNKAAHQGDIETDMALLSLGHNEQDTLSLFRGVYSFDPFRFLPNYGGVRELGLSEENLEMLNMRGSISSHIALEPSDRAIASAVREFLVLESNWQKWIPPAGVRVPHGLGENWDTGEALGRGASGIDQMREIVQRVLRLTWQAKIRRT